MEDDALYPLSRANDEEEATHNFYCGIREVPSFIEVNFHPLIKDITGTNGDKIRVEWLRKSHNCVLWTYWRKFWKNRSRVEHADEGSVHTTTSMVNHIVS